MAQTCDKTFRLVVLAAASLYLELAVIRFTSAEVLYLGYFSNFVLISAFVGLGLGFLSVRRGINLARPLPFLLLFLFALVLVSSFDASALRDKFGLFFFGNLSGTAGLPGELLLTVLFIATASLFAALGQQIGVVFKEFDPLTAYTYDIGGSLLGIGLFSAQSAAWSGPVTWVLTGGFLLVLGFLLGGTPEARRSAGHVGVAVASVVLLLLSADGPDETTWSPYQKLEYRDYGGRRPAYLMANGVLHQGLWPAGPAGRSWYGVPYDIHTRAGGALANVLIVGAGSGTDAAVALQRGAASVDAVEIDPGILEIGERHHPDRPYADRRVTTHVADGRGFLRNTSKKYDLIIFALPDSLMRLSSVSSVRLESYLFTLEAFSDVRNRIRPGGSFALYNQYRWAWLRDKIAVQLREVFGRDPLQIERQTTTVFVVGTRINAEARPRGGFERLATDDWPFIYMQRPGVHWLYLGMVAMFLLFAAGGVWLLAPRGTLRRPDWPFFLMGVAFLLLETRSISFFSLLFGTTWHVNSLAFAGILGSVLAANLIVQHLKIRRRALLFGLLFAGIVVAYLSSPSLLLGVESQLPRYLLATALMFFPIFMANLVFSREFRDSEESTRAFGWNLLGAVAGGGLEYASLLIGQQNLLWIVAACYLAAGALFVRQSRVAGQP